METKQTTKKPFYKNKLFIIPMIMLAVVGLVSAAVFIANINATATVSEAFSTLTTDVSYSGMPGETVCVDVPITNAANVPLDVELTYVENPNLAIGNPNGVIYTTNMDSGLDQTLAPGANNVTTCATYDAVTPIGDIAGTVTINRV